ncbi:MAG: methylmalonyl Co-A mutase-associated GTPase MeaB [Candidatus Eremiobacteraeota bacterium]|nr:methylmalonyl Co-A mutase-associated GTPase MeaB [Candidatus Eremiobacteraeota bacterium]
MKLRSAEEFVSEILKGNRLALAKAITLIESERAEDQKVSSGILKELIPRSGASIRLGITGVPGAGKSTFIEALGCHLTDNNHNVAVLAIDPSSTISGGSLLADKTRMEKLSVSPRAFIRPSPSSSHLGGVARKTRETMILCEAAGFDVVLLETVGVGQSEIAAASMVDFFLVLMLPNAGDEIQGIKKGVIELADAIIINKADGNNVEKALMAREIYKNALLILTPASLDWRPPVLTCSALEGRGMDEIWKTVVDHQVLFKKTGELLRKRREQDISWMWSLLEGHLRCYIFSMPSVKKAADDAKKAVLDGVLTPDAAAVQILNTIIKAIGPA